MAYLWNGENISVYIRFRNKFTVVLKVNPISVFRTKKQGKKSADELR